MLEGQVMSKKYCEHYNVERFDIGPLNERWYECIFCKRQTGPTKPKTKNDPVGPQ